MPTLIVDPEQAKLIKVAVEMLTAALMARVERVDPGKAISNALHLQANKLATVLAELDQPDPPEFGQLEEGLRRGAIHHAETLVASGSLGDRNAAWAELRRIAITPGFPAKPQA